MKGYKQSIATIAEADIPADMFVRSTIIAYIFEKDKEKVINDLLNFRAKKRGIRQIPR